MGVVSYIIGSIPSAVQGVLTLALWCVGLFIIIDIVRDLF